MSAKMVDSGKVEGRLEEIVANNNNNNNNNNDNRVGGRGFCEKIERHLEFLDFSSDDGRMILGSSNLTGRHWIGSLWYFSESSCHPSVESSVSGLECDYGIVDGFFVGSDGKHILAALDNGAVEYVTLNNGDTNSCPCFLERIACAQEHDDIISGVTRTPDRIITCSYDKSIVTLDINTLALITRFDSAHSDLISSISANSLDPNVVASAGNDGFVATWDLRSESLISKDIYGHREPSQTVWPTAVEWSPQDDQILLIGTQSGEVGMYDVRNCKGPLSVDDSAFDHQIYRIKFSPYSPDIVAVSADSSQVRIFEIKTNFKLAYKDDRHEDFVRGLAWHPKTKKLWSCGWDHLIFEHEFSHI